MTEISRRIFESGKRTDQKIDELNMKFLSFESSKVDLVPYKEEVRDILKNLDKINFGQDKMSNSLTQMENWIEKYQPLRIQK